MTKQNNDILFTCNHRISAKIHQHVLRLQTIVQWTMGLGAKTQIPQIFTRLDVVNLLDVVNSNSDRRNVTEN